MRLCTVSRFPPIWVVRVGGKPLSSCHHLCHHGIMSSWHHVIIFVIISSCQLLAAFENFCQQLETLGNFWQHLAYLIIFGHVQYLQFMSTYTNVCQRLGTIGNF